MLLLVRHSAKGSVAQEGYLATAPNQQEAKVAFHNAIVEKFHVHQADVYIPTLERVGSFGVYAVAHSYRKDSPSSS